MINTQRGKGHSAEGSTQHNSEALLELGTDGKSPHSTSISYFPLPCPSDLSITRVTVSFSPLSSKKVWSLSLKKQTPTLCILPSRPFPEYSIFKVLWLCPHLTLFDEAPTEKTTLETSPPPVLGSALLSSAAKHPEYPPAYKGATS